MKVLAIRGEKLASLEERFAVEFASGQLERAGLIAITGPTGAGKSTLLDAMCLALFNETPRLSGGGGPLIGLLEDDETLLCSENDRRNILRRGAASGYAQVDFLSGNGKRYRSTYSLRRARNKSSGKIQPPELTLVELDSGQQIQKARFTDTLELIEQLVGLTFAQFRRSVLLAQGDFAAFLKAGERDRSLLLEQMTGTELYGEISRQSFLRARDEQIRLENLKQSVTVNLLPDEERAAMTERKAVVEQEIAAFKTLSDELNAEREWRRRLDECRQAVTQAEQIHARAREAVEAFSADAKTLSDTEIVEPFRRVVETVDACGGQANRADQELKSRLVLEATAEQATSLAEGVHKQSLEALNQAEERSQNMQPELEQARALDANLESATRELKNARAAADLALKAARDAADELKTVRELRDACAARIANLASWMNTHRAVEKPAVGWTHCKHLIQEFDHNHRGLEKQTLTQNRIAREISNAEKKRDASLKAEKEARKSEAKSNEALTLARERAEAAPLDARRTARESAAAAMKTLEELCRLHGDAARAFEAVRAEGVRAEAERSAAASKDQEAAVLRTELERLRNALGETERTLEAVQAALELEDHRAQLRLGESCPLCGALEHPWAKEGAPGNAVLKEFKKKKKDIQTSVDATNNAEAAARSTSDAHTRAAKDCDRRATEERKKQANAEQQWLDVRATIADDELPAACLSCNATELSKRLERAVVELKTKQDAEQEALKFADDKGHAQDFYAKAAQALADASKAARNSESELETLKLQQKSEQEKAETFQKGRDATLEGLSGYFETRANWKDDLLATPAAFEKMIAGEVTEFLNQQTAKKSAESELGGLDGRVSTAGVMAADRETAASKSVAHSAECEGLHAGIAAERAKLLSGRKTSDVSAELEAAIKIARQNESAASRKLAEARQQLAGARASREAAQKTVTECATALTAAKSTLAETLSNLGIDESILRSRLSRGQEWIRIQRERKKALEDNALVALNSLNDKRNGLREHEEKRQVVRPLEEVNEELARLESRAETARNERYTLTARLDEDTRNREKDREHRERIARQTEAAELWGGISELIGAADGKKFRQFAQSLTLESLLEHANRHLGDLHPRFALERVPRNDLEIQVIDRDMGGERRGVSTLSGGEMFLVSLALALSLSSLASSRTRIDSLFIDEGFGSLDPASLEMALSALDALQADGRQITVISHVAGMAERLGAQVCLVPKGSGRSVVTVSAGV